MELGLTPDTRQEVDPAALAEAARGAGFTALGAISGRYDAEAFRSAGLRCHELLGLQVGDDLAAADAMAARLAEDAAALGADWVLTTFQAELGPAVIDAVGRWAAAFTDAGSGLAVEFSPLGTVPTISTALEVLAAAGSSPVGIVVDSWNACLGPSSWAELESVPLDAIAYVQFADALEPRGEPDLEEAMTRRTLPGHGVLDLGRFVATLRDRGWDGLVSLQVLSDDIRRLPLDEQVRLQYEAGLRYWG